MEFEAEVENAISTETEACPSDIGEDTDEVTSAVVADKPELDGQVADLSGLFDQPVKLVDPDLAVDAVAEIFDAMTEVQYRDLRESLEQVGQLLPAVVWNGRLVDGRSRRRGCRELGRKLKVVEWNGKGSLALLVAALNRHRRHESEESRALAGVRLKKLLEGEARERMVRGTAPDPREKFPQGTAADLAGKAVGVSGKTVQAAEKVLEDGAPELIAALTAGEIKVHPAAALATLPKDEQVRAIRGGKAAVQAKVKETKARKEARQPTRGRAGSKSSGNAAGAGQGKTISFSASESLDSIARKIEAGLGPETSRKLGGLLVNNKS